MMEQNFYNDDFEDFLKESTKDFRMYPSRKVWFGIYNDLHPGRKWPSLAVTLVLVSAILFVGISNNNSINVQRSQNINILLASQVKQSSAKPISDHEAAVPPIKLKKEGQAHTMDAPVRKPASVNTKENFVSMPNKKVNTAQQNISTNLTRPVQSSANEETGMQYIARTSKLQSNLHAKTVIKTNGSLADGEVTMNEENEPVSFTGDKQIMNSTENNLLILSAEKEAQLTVKKDENKIDLTTYAWIENYAFYNKPAQKRWQSRSAIQFYITPSIGFRSFGNSEVKSQVSNNSLVSGRRSENPGMYMAQIPAINMEVGGQIIYALNNKLRIKGGLQFNYSNYITQATRLTHPVPTYVVLHGSNGVNYSQPYTSSYANKVDPLEPENLNNKTLQISTPVGIEYKLAGKNKLRLFSGATIQPTIITAGNAYILSEDKLYLADATSLLRRFNLNGTFESYLSYTTASGAAINIGPQIRYQFLSTYNKSYTNFEKRYNVGLKIGFTTSF